MTNAEATKVIQTMLAVTDLSVRGNLTADMVKACRMAIKALSEPTISLSVIEKINTEVGNLEWYGDDTFWDGVNAVTSIIDKAVKEYDR